MRLFFAHLFIAGLVFAAVAGDSLSDSIAAHDRPGFFHHLLQIGRFDQASLEYERLRFDGYHDSCALACELGNALLNAREAEKAEALFEEAAGMTQGASQDSGKAVSGLIRAYLMLRKPALARSELDGLDSTAREALGNEEIAFYRGLTHASSYQVDSTRHTLGVIGAGSRFATRTRKIDSLLAWYRSRELKNPLKTFLYSSAIPGWGHWYVGDRKKAVASFALMAGLSGVLCYEGYRFYRGDTRERYVRGMDLFLVWGLVWRRYYGGIRKAAHQRAAEINRNVQLEYQERLRGIVAEE